MAHTRLRPSFTFSDEKLAELKRIAPEAFADGRVNWEVLKEALGEHADDESAEAEHFGLNWPGKREARRMAGSPSTGALVPKPGDGLNEDSTRNIFIEGENLEVLKLLQKAYRGKVKMIYIDPPYNTGNDFVYEDDFTEPLEEYLRRTGQVDEEGRKLTTNTRADGRFHSKWLSMMYPRLRLARQLLRDDGVIVIHIDENEVSNLNLLLNEVFGEENNLGSIIWNKGNPKGDARGVASQHETILCYSRNKQSVLGADGLLRNKKNAEKILAKCKALFKKIGKEGLPDEVEDIKKRYGITAECVAQAKRTYTLEDVNAELRLWMKGQDFSGGEKAYNEVDEQGRVFQRVSMSWPNKTQAGKDYFSVLKHPVTKKACPTPDRGWRFPSKTLLEMLEKGKVIFGEDETTQPRQKYLLEENMMENIPSVIDFGGSDDRLFAELDVDFDNPKPVRFSQNLIGWFADKDALVMDFFAGSGTTAHAVQELNDADGGQRQFVLVQLPEVLPEKHPGLKQGFKAIADISKERLRRAFKKNKSSCGFKSLALTHSNYRAWKDYHGTDAHALEDLFAALETPLREGWSVEGLTTEVMLLEGFPLDSRVEVQKAFKKNIVQRIHHEWHAHALFVCLDKQIHAETIAALVLGEGDTFICLDTAIDDQSKLRLSDKGMIKTI